MSFYSRIKQLAAETAVYGVSSILGRMLNFLLFPFYSNVFPPDLYGVVTVVFTAFIFLNIVYQYGMESAYLKFASVGVDQAERRTTFSTAFWSLLGTSMLFSVLLVGFREPVAGLLTLEAEWSFLLYYAAAILLLDALTIVPFAELRLRNRPWRFATIRITNILVNIGMNLLLILGLGMGIEGIFLANLVASATSLVLLVPTYAAGLRLHFDATLWRKLLRFGLPFLPSGIGYAITERVNIFFLGRMPPERVLALYGDQIDTAYLADGSAYGEYVVGVFNGAMKLAVFMTLVVQMFRFAWQPFFLQHAGDADAKPLFARVFTLFTAGALFVFLAVSFFAQELVALPLPGGRHLVAPSYWLGLSIVPLALLGYLFQGWYYNFAAAAYIEKKTKYLAYCALVGSAVALVLNVLLVPRYGMFAAVGVIVLAYATMAFMLYLIVQRFYTVPYAWGQVLGLGVLAAALFFVWHRLPILQAWWVEGLLLVTYLGGLFALRIIPGWMVQKVRQRVSRVE